LAVDRSLLAVEGRERPTVNGERRTLTCRWPIAVGRWLREFECGYLRPTANGERLPIVGRSLLVVRRDPL